MVRTAFTLIELIFAIVVIGITVISLPTMNQVSTSALEGNGVQEAIFIAATELNQAVTANWDENSLEDGNFSARVIDINNVCENNINLATYRQKPGHVNQPLHRRCLDSNDTQPTAVNVSDDIFSLNDMSKYNGTLENDSNPNKASYKRKYNTSITVSQSASFNTRLNDQNIKRVVVTIKDSDDNSILTELTTYSANIGEVDYYKRTY